MSRRSSRTQYEDHLSSDGSPLEQPETKGAVLEDGALAGPAKKAAVRTAQEGVELDDVDLLQCLA